MQPWEPECGRWWLSRRLNQQQILLRLPRRHLGTRLSDVHVDLAANAETSRQVNTRLDRKPDAGNQRPLVGGLEVVEMWSRSVQIAVDRMSRAMHEVVSEPRRANHAARRVVERCAGYRFALLPAIPEQGDGRIPRPTHCLPHLANLSTRLPSREPHPRLIRKHSA